MKKKVINIIAIVGIVMFIVQEFVLGQFFYLLPNIFGAKDALFIVQKIIAPIFMIVFVYLSISKKRQELVDFVILFIAIYYTFAYNDPGFIKLDTWAKILFFIAFPLVFILKSYLFLKQEKNEKQSDKYGFFIGITVFIVLLFAWLYITRIHI